MDTIFQYSDYDSDDNGEIVTSSAQELVFCMICEVNPKQYKCPACSMLTCSLACCKQHKITSNCTGKRNRVGYVSIRDYNDSNLRDDYHFLEDVLQTRVRGRRMGLDRLGKDITDLDNETLIRSYR